MSITLQKRRRKILYDGVANSTRSVWVQCGEGSFSVNSDA